MNTRCKCTARAERYLRYGLQLVPNKIAIDCLRAVDEDFVYYNNRAIFSEWNILAQVIFLRGEVHRNQGPNGYETNFACSNNFLNSGKRKASDAEEQPLKKRARIDSTLTDQIADHLHQLRRPGNKTSYDYLAEATLENGKHHVRKAYHLLLQCLMANPFNYDAYLQMIKSYSVVNRNLRLMQCFQLCIHYVTVEMGCIREDMLLYDDTAQLQSELDLATSFYHTYRAILLEYRANFEVRSPGIGRAIFEEIRKSMETDVPCPTPFLNASVMLLFSPHGDIQQRLRRAIELQMRAIEKCGTPYRDLNHRSFAHCGLASAYVQLGDREQALKHLNEALIITPHFFRARQQRCQILLEMNRLHEALQDCDAMLEIEPDNNPDLSKVYYQRSVILAQLDDTKRSFEALEIAMALDPDNISPHVSLLELGQTDDDGEWFRQFIEKHVDIEKMTSPERIEVLLNLLVENFRHYGMSEQAQEWDEKLSNHSRSFFRID
jgi:tetratricopeptide (TPR) repeat protein